MYLFFYKINYIQIRYEKKLYIALPLFVLCVVRGEKKANYAEQQHCKEMENLNQTQFQPD